MTHAQHVAQRSLVVASLMLAPKRCDRQFEATRKGGK